MAEEALSDAIQDYLKEIYKLRADGGKVTTTRLARRLRVSPASVSAMVKKLAALGLAEHVPYRGVDLTPAGEKVALEVVRHHRLLELYLAQTLGIAVESVHAEADRLEHALSEELEARIDSALGYPTHDPHGDPIPDAQLQMQAEHESARSRRSVPARRAPSAASRTTRSCSRDCPSWGSSPAVRSPVKKVRPLTISIDGTEQVVPRKLADAVGVG